MVNLTRLGVEKANISPAEADILEVGCAIDGADVAMRWVGVTHHHLNSFVVFLSHRRHQPTTRSPEFEPSLVQEHQPAQFQDPPSRELNRFHAVVDISPKRTPPTIRPSQSTRKQWEIFTPLTLWE